MRTPIHPGEHLALELEELGERTLAAFLAQAPRIPDHLVRQASGNFGAELQSFPARLRAEHFQRVFQYIG